MIHNIYEAECRIVFSEVKPSFYAFYLRTYILHINFGVLTSIWSSAIYVVVSSWETQVMCIAKFVRFASFMSDSPDDNTFMGAEKD